MIQYGVSIYDADMVFAVQRVNVIEYLISVCKELNWNKVLCVAYDCNAYDTIEYARHKLDL